MGGSGQTVIPSGLSASIEPGGGSGHVRLEGRTLVNHGTLTLTEGAILLSGAEIENTGTFKVNSEAAGTQTRSKTGRAPLAGEHRDGREDHRHRYYQARCDTRERRHDRRRQRTLRLHRRHEHDAGGREHPERLFLPARRERHGRQLQRHTRLARTVLRDVQHRQRRNTHNRQPHPDRRNAAGHGTLEVSEALSWSAGTVSGSGERSSPRKHKLDRPGHGQRTSHPRRTHADERRRADIPRRNALHGERRADPEHRVLRRDSQPNGTQTRSRTGQASSRSRTPGPSRRPQARAPPASACRSTTMGPSKPKPGSSCSPTADPRATLPPALGQQKKAPRSNHQRHLPHRHERRPLPSRSERRYRYQGRKRRAR